MTFYFYFSDILYLSFCALCFYAVVYSYYHHGHDKIWKKILGQESALISAVIFLGFLVISILDSIHMNLQGRGFTLLDYLLHPLDQVYEYSYSSPCSIVGFIPRVLKKGGEYLQYYPHLSYVPKSWQMQQQVSSWILVVMIKITCAYLLFGLILFYYLRKSSRTLRVILVSLLGFMYLSTVLYGLSRHLHIFGTSQIGQDIFYQAIKSIRTGLFISMMTTFIILPFALTAGLSAGYFGGKIDKCIQFIYTIIQSIPSILLMASALLSWQMVQEYYFSDWSVNKQADMKILVICALLGLTNWASLCRYIRAEVFKLREMNYVKAAKLLGSSSYFILRRHLLPNVMHMVIITLVLEFSYFILAESVLTYIGIGVSPVTMSWGNMINAARLELARVPVVWWPLVTAFGFMFVLVLVCNLLADAVRKALNPKEEII